MAIKPSSRMKFQMGALLACVIMKLNSMRVKNAAARRKASPAHGHGTRRRLCGEGRRPIVIAARRAEARKLAVVKYRRLACGAPDMRRRCHHARQGIFAASCRRAFGAMSASAGKCSARPIAYSRGGRRRVAGMARIALPTASAWRRCVVRSARERNNGITTWEAGQRNRRASNRLLTLRRMTNRVAEKA